MSWRYDLENIPKGRTVEVPGPKGSVRRVFKSQLVVIAVSDGETVTLSRWIPDESRWNMIGKNERPIAWMEWPDHPGVGE